MENFLISMLCFIVAGSLHELAHAWSAYRMGDDTAKLSNRLTLNPLSHIDIIGTIALPALSFFTGAALLGWMRPVPVNSNRFRDPSKGMAITSFAGPYCNLLQALGGIFLFVLVQAIFPTINLTVFSPLLTILHIYFQINLVLMIFNLIPFPPLDGGWILRYMLPYKAKESFDRVYPYGQFILFALVFTGIFSKVFGFLVSIFLFPIEFLIQIHFLLLLLPIGIALIPLFVFLAKTKKGSHLFQSKERATRKNRKNLPAKVGTKSQIKIDPKPVPLSAATQRAEQLYKRLQSGESFTSEDEWILDEFKKELTEPTHALCDNEDFDEIDPYCNNCENYKSCLFRKILTYRR